MMINYLDAMLEAARVSRESQRARRAILRMRRRALRGINPALIDEEAKIDDRGVYFSK